MVPPLDRVEPLGMPSTETPICSLFSPRMLRRMEKLPVMASLDPTSTPGTRLIIFRGSRPGGSSLMASASTMLLARVSPMPSLWAVMTISSRASSAPAASTAPAVPGITPASIQSEAPAKAALVSPFPRFAVRRPIIRFMPQYPFLVSAPARSLRPRRSASIHYGSVMKRFIFKVRHVRNVNLYVSLKCHEEGFHPMRQRERMGGRG
ncbi:hypothetical protein AZA_88463 [Nitrospirillum viridazoti Y2]|nr:hypothetical protein AZA_88463 [Nitrospirillum amazonense Y2]